VASSQPTPSCGEQQSPVVAHEHSSAHSLRVSSAHCESQMLLQHGASRAQMQVRHRLSSQLGPPCALQQSPPGVGVAAGVSVGGGVQGQLDKHSTDASETQVASHSRLQQSGSMPQTQVWQAPTSQPVPPTSGSRAVQHGPPGVGVGNGVCEH